MSPSVPTGPIGSVGGAVARRAKTYWDRGHEGHKLISRIAKRVRGDATIPHEIRAHLADQLSERIRIDPLVQGAIISLLDGNEILSAQEALSVRISELCAGVVTWPPDFDTTAFGMAVASHAVAAINEVKATDREAAHHDHLVTRQAFASGLQDALAHRDPPSHGVGALLRGPLRQIDKESSAQAATDLQSEGRLFEAAGIASDVANALDDAGLAPAAVSFHIWAAQLSAASGEREEATQTLADLVWRYLDSPLRIAAHSAVDQLRQIGVPAWQGAITECCGRR